jgi:hypothetical protein
MREIHRLFLGWRTSCLQPFRGVFSEPPCKLCMNHHHRRNNNNNNNNHQSASKQLDHLLISFSLILSVVCPKFCFCFLVFSRNVESGWFCGMKLLYFTSFYTFSLFMVHRSVIVCSFGTLITAAELWTSPAPTVKYSVTPFLYFFTFRYIFSP